MSSKILKLMSFIAIFYSANSFAAPIISGFSESVSEQLNLVDQSLACKDWKATSLYFTIAPSVAFEIPEIVEIKFVPEVTLVWEREE